MSRSVFKEYLASAREELSSALEHLEFSKNSIANISDAVDSWTPTQLEKAEAFTSRFARVVDLLVHRVLRAIDRYELNEPGTLLDVANRAESRNLISNVDWLRELKDVRNRIAHDYAGHQLPELLAFCLNQFTELKNTCLRLDEYINQLL